MSRLLPFRRAAPEVPLEDAELMARCGRGDNRALAELFDRHGGTVHRFLARMGGVDDHEAPDLVQATFMQVWKSAARFEGRSAVRTWILGIAANTARMHVRKDVRRKRMLTVVRERPAGRGADPARDAETHQLMDRLQVALAQLKPQLREAFVLCEIEGVRGVDAARILALKEGTLYRRLHDARIALRAALGGR